MSIVHIQELYQAVLGHLSSKTHRNISVNLAGESLQIKVDGERYLNNIGVWPSGCCDTECINIETEETVFKHLEFQDTVAAQAAVLREVDNAINQG